MLIRCGGKEDTMTFEKDALYRLKVATKSDVSERPIPAGTEFIYQGFTDGHHYMVRNEGGVVHRFSPDAANFFEPA